MSDTMSVTDMLSRLRADAADERFEGARLGPTAVRELLRHIDELEARLAEIERAEDLDADIIEAQRAVVQQLASRPACDWPGKCKHKRPALVAAPEQVKPRFAPCGRSAGTCGRSTHGCGRHECQADIAAPERAEHTAASALCFAELSEQLENVFTIS